MSKSVGIVGAGLIGRLLAVQLSSHGWEVHVYERDGRMGWESCSFAAAGMIAPYCELDVAETLIHDLGVLSLELWPTLLESLSGRVFFSQQGSLVVSHVREQDSLTHLYQKIRNILGSEQNMQWLDASDMSRMEPELADRFRRGLFFPEEAQINTHELLGILADTMQQQGVQAHWKTQVDTIEPHRVMVGTQEYHHDWVIDCRGLAAKQDWPGLRGVRGELVIVRTPDVKLSRPVRMMHPRYPLYVVPRQDNIFVIGATSIDSEDMSPISLRSSLELLSAAYSLHPGFAEARIIHSVVQCRPALPDHLPQIQWQDGLLRINGLYRHGYLCAPAIISLALDVIHSGTTSQPFAFLIQQVA